VVKNERISLMVVGLTHLCGECEGSYAVCCLVAKKWT